ncbi:Cacna1h, partial [Symbiodinium necroappetens]
ANFWSVAAELLRSYSAQNLQTNFFLVTSATSRSWTRAFELCQAYKGDPSVTNSALGALARHGHWRLAIALLHGGSSVSASETGDEREHVIGTNSAMAAFVVEGPWPRALGLASGCSDALGGSAAVAAAHHWEVSLTLLWTLQRQFHLDEDYFNAALRVCARSCEGRLPGRFRGENEAD